MVVAPPKSVFDMILEWSTGRCLWQRDALRRIVLQGKLTPEDINALVQLCLKGQGAEGIDIEASPLAAEHIPVVVGVGAAIALTSIADVSSVNCLAPGQTLPFAATGVTVVYGDNGAGKSGYARVLKRACRARFIGEILPNAFNAPDGSIASATIAYSSGAAAAPSVAWVNNGVPHPILSSVSVFDRECAAIHVREQNEVAFRPFGLDVPDELAAACQAVKEVLTAQQVRLKSSRDAVFEQPTFNSNSPVGEILSNLKATTDLGVLEALAVLSEAEETRVGRLNEDLARDPLRVAAEQRNYAQSLRRFADDLASILSKTSDEQLSHILALDENARQKRAAANLAAEGAFGGAVVAGVGEATWRELWEAARRYSETVAYPGEAFPPTKGKDAHCLLCHQILPEDAKTRMSEFEKFIKADTERVAADAERDFSEARRTLENSPIRISAFPLRRQLSLASPKMANAVLTSLASARLRRRICLNSIGTDDVVHMRDAAPDPVEQIRDLASAAERYAAELTAAADPAGRRLLEAERDALRDRKALEGLLPKAKLEIVRLAQIDRAAKCIAETATNAVTSLGNSIADQVITPRMRDRFQEEIQKLAASRVRVDIVRSGGKYGSPQYQVRLFANDKAKVHSVLSEGEQTCVALAVFLAELATAGHSSCLVFDDPVSSLDHRWRRKVAERLVEEAAGRQIIVFTHDLVFLNDLQVLSSKNGIPIKEVSLYRTSAGAGVVHEGLPWAAMKVPQRLDNLEKDARAARQLHDNHDEPAYIQAVAKFYNLLRSTWERALEDRAFCNVVTRHRDYIDAKNLKVVTALTEVDAENWAAGFKTCCDITDAHDPSRGRNAAPPPPADLLKHVAELKDWDENLRQRQAPLR